MSFSAVQEFAKIASVDSVYEIYEMADKLGGSPQRAMQRRQAQESDLQRRMRESRLAKLEAKRTAGAPAAAPVASAAEAPVAATRSTNRSPNVFRSGHAASHGNITLPPRAVAAPAAAAAETAAETAAKTPGLRQKAMEMLTKHKGKAVAGTALAGAMALGYKNRHRFTGRNEHQ
jgi:hypothetical protein